MKVVTYYRVSTAAQGRSGLGLEAQRDAVEAFCRARGCEVLAEFTEIESGKRNDRPQLAAALHRAKVTGATLVIAKLDRLSRNAAFLLTLRDSGVEFIAADMPDACRLTVGILAMVAEQEREAISARTKAALASAKARGSRLGNPNGAAAIRRAAKGNAGSIAVQKADADQRARDLAATVAQMRAEGLHSLPALAQGLNDRHIRTARGGRWHPSSVRNLLARLEATVG
ncbi:resolvase [Sphingomonas sp. ABOLD]|uniref:DNA invertase Pin-like site-specific DNA recombinase n=1 Tax=Sphingomonas trueperi TaxID=53317 RepID=A0A7X6BCF1_9SPHN|nr:MULTISPECIES: recombinase family protein [Sphingomonas]NJB98029.1 DNA invertase Pin-like site-specific DNA recombinase [Sphingomonas trueperi]RSV46323.1 resolvase [Sphingomonas sp. ABOLD]